MAKIIFSEGKVQNKEVVSLKETINGLQKMRESLHSINIDNLIDFFSEVGKQWQNDKSLPSKINYNINHLISFVEKKNLIHLLNVALRGNYKVLDEFIEPINEEEFLYHTQPRGLAVHWLAGNVSLLGIFSIIQTLLTKNVSLIKASSKSYKELITLLSYFSKINAEKFKGLDIAKTMAVVLVDNDNKENQMLMSKNADIRIAWGGKEAIDMIMGLPKKFYCEDIIYGPKYSYVVIDKESLDHDAKKIAGKLALDISIFDQYACSSPHTVFIENGGKINAQDFSKILAEELERVNRLIIPKQETEPGKVMEIFNIRTEYQIKGEVFSSKNSDWTVIYSKESGLANACFSRVVFVRPLSDLNSIKDLNDRYKQTLGTSIASFEKRKKFVDNATLFGVDRCPQIGKLTFFESPWDGIFGIDRMVRWITTWK